MEKEAQKPNNYQNQDFDLEADISRLKKSSYVLIVVLVVLLIAFFILMVLSLSGTFELQNEGNLPTILKVVYPVSDGIAVSKDPSSESDAIGTLKLTDRVFEVKRIPGYVKVEWNDKVSEKVGWVENSKVKSAQEKIAQSAGMTSAPLDFVNKIEYYQKDILVSGKLVNNSEPPIDIKNIHLEVTFLAASKEVLDTEDIMLSTNYILKKGGAVPFNIVGQGLFGRVAFVTFEIKAFESARPQLVE